MPRSQKNHTKSMFKQEEYDIQQKVDLSIQLNRWILRPMGAWPHSSGISLLQKYLYLSVNTLCSGLIGFLLASCLLYTFFEAEGVYNKIRMTGPTSFYVMACLKYSSLLFHIDDVRECIEYIETDWRNTSHSKDLSIMMENANSGRRLVIICIFFMYSGAIFFYVALPAAVGKIQVPDQNITFIPLVYTASTLIVDTRQSPINEVLFAIQNLSGFLAHNISASACSLAAALAFHACGQIEVMMCWLEHLVDGREDLSKDVDGRLEKIVNQHVRILSFLTLTEKVMKQISLVEVLGCTMNMCFLGYYTIMEWESVGFTTSLTYVILLMSFTFNIFIFCYIGDHVAEQCKKIGELSYMTDWYRLPAKKSPGLILMIAMANSSMKLTAGSLIELSLSSFADVVKAAVGYLNMLRTLTS